MRHLFIGGLALACVAASPLFSELRVPPKEDLPALSSLGDMSTSQSWLRRRTEIRQQWLEILGPMPQRAPLEPTILSDELLDDHRRLLIRYRSDSQPNEAYLLIPRHIQGKLPGVVCLHPTSRTSLNDPVGLTNRENVHHALHLVRRGYVCVAPRNFLWSVEGRSYQQAADVLLARGPYTTGMAKMLFDATRAVDLLVERPEVDSKRIAAIGHSLGGKEALYLAAFDERIIAAISCEGGVGLSFSNWDADWYLGKQIRSPEFRHDNHEVMSLIAPRALLVIGGESADGAKSWSYAQSVLPLWRLYDAEERIGLLRHMDGHNFPSPGPKRDLAYRWLDHCMEITRSSP